MALNVLRGMYERKQRKLAADRQGYGWVVGVAWWVYVYVIQQGNRATE
jgi:hypothetical protein